MKTHRGDTLEHTHMLIIETEERCTLRTSKSHVFTSRGVPSATYWRLLNWKEYWLLKSKIKQGKKNYYPETHFEIQISESNLLDDV